MTKTDDAPQLGGNKNKVFRDAGNAPMMSGAWYATLDLRELIALMDERQQRLFACDCAERVLQIFEDNYPDDDGPRKAIEVARRYANGEASEDEQAEAWSVADLARSDEEVARGVLRSPAWPARLAASRALAARADNAARWSAGWMAKVLPAAEAWQKERAIWYLRGENEER